MRALALQHPRRLVVAGAAVAAVAINLGIGAGAAIGQRAMLLALVVGTLPAIVIGFGALVESNRAILAWAALGLNFTGVSIFSEALPVPGGAQIFPADVLLLLAVGSWLASRLSGVRERNPVQLSRVFGWPLGLLAITILVGVAIGHERYGAPFVGRPLRLLLYAAIALALTDLTVVAAWRAVTIVFYSGAVVQSLWAVYYLATGTSQTTSDVLSTGGTRVLALSVAIYLTGSLVCALLNLEVDKRPGRQLLHLMVAGLALFGIIVSFGRTTYAAVVLILPLVLASRRYVRRAVLWLIPLFVPVFAIAALLTPTVAPSLVPTLQARFSGTSTNDTAVDARELMLDATLEGVSDEWLTGVGFGRKTEYQMFGQVIELEGDPHNSYAWILAGGGVLALSSLLIFCSTYVVDALQRLRGASVHGQALVVWSLATWTAFMINALTGPILSDPEMLMTIWILVALPSVVAVRQATARERTR